MAWIFGRGLFLLMMLFCGPGEAVKCYLCSTKDNEKQCLYPTSYKLPLIKCDQRSLEMTKNFSKSIADNYDKIFDVDTLAMAKQIDLNCLKVATKHGNKLYTFRGCQLAEQKNLDICYKIKNADTEFVKMQHCSRCSSDGCNSAPKLSEQEVYHLLIITVAALYISF